MADEETKSETPATEKAEPAAAAAPGSSPEKKPAAKRKAAPKKKSTRKRAPTKKAAAKKTVKSAAAASKPAEAAPQGPSPTPGEQPQAASSVAAPGYTPRPRPPQRFWWKALLMSLIVVLGFIYLRGLAKPPTDRAEAPALPAATADGAGADAASRGSETDGVTAAQPAADGNTIPAPRGRYGEALPQPAYPVPPAGRYGAMQPGQEAAGGQPVYPSAPQWGYGYPYPPQQPYYPYPQPYYPPHPGPVATPQQ
jgi:hypothetical protein